MRSTSPSSPAFRRWRSTLAGRHRRAAILSLSVVALLGSAAVSTASTTLDVHAFESVEKGIAYVGNTYNVNIGVQVRGPAPVRIVAVTARSKSAGLIELEPVIGWGCDHYTRPLITAGDDLSRAPGYRIWAITDRTLRETDRHCAYLLARLVPTTKGVLRASDFTVEYGVGPRTHSIRLDYEVILNVSREGPDPQQP